jgi:hypothetical protein
MAIQATKRTSDALDGSSKIQRVSQPEVDQELVTRILKFLPPESRTITPGSHEWNQLTNDNSLWMQVWNDALPRCPVLPFLNETKIKKSGKPKQHTRTPKDIYLFVYTMLKNFDFTSIRGQRFANRQEFFKSITALDKCEDQLFVEIDQLMSIAVNRNRLLIPRTN